MPIILYTSLFAIFLVSIRIRKDNIFLDKNSSTVIKGFFIILIILSHILNHFPYGGFLGTPLQLFREILGQLVVSMFFFISGYGIVVQIDKQGETYFKSLFTNRFLRILLYTVISLIPFFIYSAILKKEHSVEDYLLSFIGLSSFGNAYWFIFAIQYCYIICSIVFLFKYKHKIIPIVIVSFFIIFYYVLFYLIKWDTWKWDTIMCFIFGLLIAYFRNNVNKLLSKKTVPIILMVVSIISVILLFYAGKTEFNQFFPYVLRCWFSNFFFCLFFVCFTKLFTLKSKILSYLGNASYALYIMHYFSILVFIDFGPISNEWINYFVLFISCMMISIPMYYLYKIIDKYITNPIVKWNRSLIDLRKNTID